MKLIAWFHAPSGIDELYGLRAHIDFCTLPNDLRSKLSEWTGEQWMIVISDDEGGATVAEQRQEREQKDADRKAREIEELKQHPAVDKLFEYFPDAKIRDIRDLDPPDDKEN